MTRRSFVYGATSLFASSAGCRQTSALPPEDRQSPHDLSTLSRRLEGKLVLPDDPVYERSRLVHSARFNDIRPKAIAFCRSANDVSESIRWAAARGVPAVPRAGGHHYLGGSLSSGLVIDVGAMNRVDVDVTRQTTRVGAGARGFDIVGALGPHRLALPLGTCPSVGIAGLTLGGGKGFSGRKLGLTCDSLVEAEVVLASGDVVVCSERNEPDLFWACRGGGGGTFGIATALRFRAHPTGVVTHFELDWRWEDGQRAFDAWNELALNAPDDLFVRLQLGRDRGGKKRQLAWIGQLFGSAEQLRSLLAPVLRSPAGSRAQLTVHEGTIVDAALQLSECKSNDVSGCKTESAESRRHFLAKSDFFDGPLRAGAVDVLFAAFEADPSSVSGWEGIQLDPAGGKVHALRGDDTAFPHRSSVAVAQYLFYWDPKADPEQLARGQARFRKMYADLRPFAAGGCYQNYPDEDLVDWERAYFGENAARLRRVKAKYDPRGFFAGKQTISGG